MSVKLGNKYLGMYVGVCVCSFMCMINMLSKILTVVVCDKAENKLLPVRFLIIICRIVYGV